MGRVFPEVPHSSNRMCPGSRPELLASSIIRICSCVYLNGVLDWLRSATTLLDRSLGISIIRFFQFLLFIWLAI